jgi:Putative prokaryotic signal transducing protein
VSKHHQPPHDPGENAASGRPTVPVAAVTSRIEAELIVGLLANYQIGAVIAADDAGGLDPALQTQGVGVLVAPSDEAAARQILADADRAAGS